MLRSRWVAATTRTSTLRGCACRRRGVISRPAGRAAAWSAAPSGTSPISSRNSVPAVGGFEQALGASVAPVKAPRSWPKSSLSSSVSGSAGAVDGDERAVRAAAAIVQGARDELLAGPGLALDQHNRVDWSEIFDEPVDLLHGGTRSDHVLERGAVFDAAAERAHLGDVVEEDDHAARIAGIVAQVGFDLCLVAAQRHALALLAWRGAGRFEGGALRAFGGKGVKPVPAEEVFGGSAQRLGGGVARERDLAALVDEDRAHLELDRGRGRDPHAGGATWRDAVRARSRRAPGR